VKAALLEFEKLSGLKANPSKSSSSFFLFLFWGGISSELKTILLDDLQMEEGKLPVRYLGVPLASSKLFAMDYRVLIEKITSRIGSWTSRQFSFARKVADD
jgi:hypothetical protein